MDRVEGEGERELIFQNWDYSWAKLQHQAAWVVSSKVIYFPKYCKPELKLEIAL